MTPRTLSRSFPLPTCATTATALLVVILLGGCGDAPEDGAGSAPGESLPNQRNVGSTELAPGETRALTPEEQKAVVDEIMRVRAKQQAEGLGGGKVEVNGAWEYTGFSYLAPDPNAPVEVRLVAVDVTLSGHTVHFDIDDIEIVDGASLISYGSDPHAEPLRLDGTLLPEDSLPAVAPKPSRWLLIYAFPKRSPTLRLEYWGIELTPKPIEIGTGGLELPFPSE